MALKLASRFNTRFTWGYHLATADGHKLTNDAAWEDICFGIQDEKMG